MKIKIIFLSLLICGIAHNLQAQISNNKILPKSFLLSQVRFNESKIYTAPNVDMKKIEKEDFLDSVAGYAPRFGYPHKVNLNTQNSGEWIRLENGDKLWFLKIKCPKAKSINLLYDKFWLPNGATLHIYNKNKSQILGAFTSKNNKGTHAKPKGFSTTLVAGNVITLEYFEPSNTTDKGIISITKVIHGYKKIKLLSNFYEKGNKDFGDSASCNININCESGDDWRNEKESVGLLLHNGSRWCSGSLLNNTANDGKLYFLSADHCIDGSGAPIEPDLDAINNPDGSIMSFIWNYESVDCNNGIDFTPLSTSGATVIANNSNTDFALFLLDESPASVGVDPYYNGWDRRNIPALRAVSIHHPRGDIKKISIENNPVSSTSYYSNLLNNNANHWRVANWDVGLTQKGSSGCPLFNQDSRVIGQLHGGDAGCIGGTYNGLPDWYGKLYSSWDGPSPQRRLKDWLDPLNSGTWFLDGKYLNGSPVDVCLGVTNPNIYVNQTFSSPTTHVVQGCNVELYNTSVINNAKLEVTAIQSLNINGHFEAKLGSELEFKND